LKLPAFSYVSVEKFILEKGQNKSILHLGCAGDHLNKGPQNNFHLNLSKKARALWGVEIDRNALQIVRSWLPEDSSGRFRYFCEDVQSMELGGNDQKFDVIVVGSIIEHLSNPGLMIEKLHKFCTFDTEIIIVTPHAFGIMNYLRVLLRKREAINKQHTCWFSVATLSELCSRYQLKATEWHTGFGWRPDSLKRTIQKTVALPIFKTLPHLGGSLISVLKIENHTEDRLGS
jgi:2-polyprenyl-3-methyl-5-hydroxy-6-metoxy-1,4-benzoquinol methylase